MAATYLAGKLGGHGRILAVDGHMSLNPRAGASRMVGSAMAWAPTPVSPCSIL